MELLLDTDIWMGIAMDVTDRDAALFTLLGIAKLMLLNYNGKLD